MSQKTGSVPHRNVNLKDVVAEFLNARKNYFIHRFQVEHDKSMWHKILNTVLELGPIFNLDYLDNIQITQKYKPQSAHLNKRQYFLHCTVSAYE